MKVLFSVYLENRLTEEKQLYFSDIIETKLTISQIDKHLEVNDHFRSVLEAGQNLAFWDIYCYYNFTQDVINKIKNIPNAKTESPTIEEPTVLEIQELNPGNANAVFYSNISECYFYRVTRVECGASGFSAIIAYIKDDPILSGTIVEVIKMMVVKLWRLIFRRKNIATTQYKRKMLYFHAKQF